MFIDKEDSHFQIICEGAHPSYSGRNPCAFNIAMALVETKQFLSLNVSVDSSRWQWKDLHVKDYVNLPWSRTPLRQFFHKVVPSGGNDNTPNVSKLSMRKNMDEVVLKSTASANFKMLVQLGKDPTDDINMFSIDTGINGHFLQGNVFDMNKSHLEGKLKLMKRGSKLAYNDVNILTLKPKLPSENGGTNSIDEL